MSDFLARVNYLTLIIFIQTPYVDFQDVVNPIKLKGEYRYINFDLNSYNGYQVHISEDSYNIENNFFYGSNIGNFFTIYSYTSDKYTSKNKTDAGYFGTVMIKLETSQREYDVKIYNFYDLIAQIGGIYEILFEFFGIFAFYIARKLYDHSLV